MLNDFLVTNTIIDGLPREVEALEIFLGKPSIRPKTTIGIITRRMLVTYSRACVHNDFELLPTDSNIGHILRIVSRPRKDSCRSTTAQRL